jgi:hypothetical protein
MKITPENEQKITALLEKMSIRDKILQMFQMDTSAHKDDFPALSEENIGSYLSLMGDEVEELREKAKKTKNAIPPIFGIDAIHGHAFRPYATIFPSQLAAACSWNEELIEEMGAATAKEVNADGLDWVFSPVLCIARDTRWGRVDETFGEDPYLIGKLGAAIIRGYEKDGLVAACAKHYIGYGEATGARDSYDTEVSMRKVREVFLPPFKEAVDAAFAAYTKEYKDCIYCIGSVLGPHPFPLMVRDFQHVVGEEAREQFIGMTGELPDAIVACVGGGSNAAGFFSGFLNDPVDIYGIEPLGRGPKLGDHAASLKYGEEGIMHGFNSIMLKDENGDPAPVYSVSSGLDYPSSGPEHAFLRDLGRVQYDVIDDEETIDAFYKLSRMEGIIPALESAHAVAYGIKLAERMGRGSVLINLSGRGDKDMDYVIEKYGIR